MANGATAMRSMHEVPLILAATNELEECRTNKDLVDVVGSNNKTWVKLDRDLPQLLPRENGVGGWEFSRSPLRP